LHPLELLSDRRHSLVKLRTREVLKDPRFLVVLPLNATRVCPSRAMFTLNVSARQATAI
jgi:hypothetical protein